jgi:hypothetical protein
VIIRNVAYHTPYIKPTKMKPSLSNSMQPLRTLITITLVLIALMLSATYALAAPPRQFEGSISSPRANAVVQGVVSIEGTANHPEFQKYEVRLAPGLNPNISDSQWIRLRISESAVVNGQLAVWDTSSVADGAYILRLRVVRLDSNYEDVDIAPINVANTVPPTVAPTPTLAETPTPLESPTPLVPGATVTSVGTPGAVATLAPSGTLQPSGTLPPTDTTGSPTTTPILIDQPTIIVSTGTPDPDAVAVVPVPTRNAGTSTSTDDNPFGIPGLPSEFPTLEAGTFTEPLIYGAAGTVGVFVVIALLYIIRGIFRAIRR